MKIKVHCCNDSSWNLVGMKIMKRVTDILQMNLE